MPFIQRAEAGLAPGPHHLLEMDMAYEEVFETDAPTSEVHTRLWQNGHAPAFRAGYAGSIPASRSNSLPR